MKRPSHASRRLRALAISCPTLLAIVTLVVLGCSNDAEPRDPSARPGRVVMIGIDGATLRVIEPMLARGALPQIGALVAGGVSGPLRSFQKITSPRIWNSIATGKRPEKHGIDGFAVPGPDGRPRLLLSHDRTAHTLWNIASDAGLSVGVVNFWNTYPPEVVNGVMVSDHLIAREVEGRRAMTKAAAPEERAALIYPAEWANRIARVQRGTPIARTNRDPFRDNEEIPGWIDREQLSRRFEEDDTLMRFALEIEGEIRPDLLMVLLPGIDRVSHFLWGSLEPQDRYPEVLQQTREQQRAGRAALEAYYSYTDELLAALLRRYSDDDLVIVLSDHGFESGGGFGVLTGVHEGEAALDGVVFVRGPGIPRRASSKGLSVLDIAPTVLAWLGLPIGEDMDGSVAPFLALREAPRRIATHDTEPVQRSTETPSGLESRIVEELRSLGYIDGEKQFMRGAHASEGAVGSPEGAAASSKGAAASSKGAAASSKGAAAPSKGAAAAAEGEPAAKNPALDSGAQR